MKRPKFIVKELCTSGVLTVNSSDVTVVYFIQYGKFKHWLICNFFRTALVWSITQRTAVSYDPEERSSRPLCWQKTEITFICFCLPWNRFALLLDQNVCCRPCQITYIQGDSGGICATLGCDSMSDSKQKSSYEHGSDFERLQSYGRLKLGIEGNDYWQWTEENNKTT